MEEQQKFGGEKKEEGNVCARGKNHTAHIRASAHLSFFLSIPSLLLPSPPLLSSPTSSPPPFTMIHSHSNQIPRIVKKYDSECEACCGTGEYKTRRFGTSRFRKTKATSCKCMMCGGVGFVRISTTRVNPDFSQKDSMPAEYEQTEKKDQGPTFSIK